MGCTESVAAVPVSRPLAYGNTNAYGQQQAKTLEQPGIVQKNEKSDVETASQISPRFTTQQHAKYKPGVIMQDPIREDSRLVASQGQQLSTLKNKPQHSTAGNTQHNSKPPNPDYRQPTSPRSTISKTKSQSTNAASAPLKQRSTQPRKGSSPYHVPLNLQKFPLYVPAKADASLNSLQNWTSKRKVFSDTKNWMRTVGEADCKRKEIRERVSKAKLKEVDVKLVELMKIYGVKELR